MERLTHRYTDGEAWASIYKVCACGENECNGPIIDHLAAYEDTGLEPEEIENLTRALDAAAKLLTGYGHCTHYPGYICDKGFTTPGVCEVCIKEHLLGREKAKEG